MKKFIQFTLFILFLLSNSSWGQLIDNFNYSGTLVANGWSAHSGAGTNSPATTNGLTYAGYPGSGIGNAALIGNKGGEDVNSTPIIGPYNTNGQAIFYSFLVNVTESSNKTGDYFIHIGNRVDNSTFTSFCARVFVKVTGDVVNFGISNVSTSPTYGTTSFAKNKTYLMIVKYTINTSGDDKADLWVISSGIPAKEANAGTPELTSLTAGQDIVNAIALRQGSSSNSVEVIVDAIRVSTNWGLAVTGTATAVEEDDSSIPTAFELNQNYPNPFNPSTSIKYSIPKNSFVSIKVYDIIGNEVRSLVNQDKPAGSYEIKFDASNMPSGVYFYSIQAGSFSQTKKMILMK